MTQRDLPSTTTSSRPSAFRPVTRTCLRLSSRPACLASLPDVVHRFRGAVVQSLVWARSTAFAVARRATFASKARWSSAWLRPASRRDCDRETGSRSRVMSVEELWLASRSLLERVGALRHDTDGDGGGGREEG